MNIKTKYDSLFSYIRQKGDTLLRRKGYMKEMGLPKGNVNKKRKNKLSRQARKVNRVSPGKQVFSAFERRWEKAYKGNI